MNVSHAVVLFPPDPDPDPENVSLLATLFTMYELLKKQNEVYKKNAATLCDFS